MNIARAQEYLSKCSEMLGTGREHRACWRLQEILDALKERHPEQFDKNGRAIVEPKNTLLAPFGPVDEMEEETTRG